MLLLSVAGCIKHSSTAKSTRVPGSGTTGVTVAGPDAAFSQGRPAIMREAVPAGYEKLIAGPVVQIGDGSMQPAKAVTLSFPPVTGGAAAHIAYRDDASGWWLPVPTERDAKTGRLTATVNHFSWWTTILDNIIGLTAGVPDSVSNSASWLEYQAGLVLSVRASMPKCSGRMPSWVKGDLIVNPDANSELFACGESNGSTLRLKVVNNRGYPVTVEFSHPFSNVSSDLPVNLRDIVQRAGNPPDDTNTRVFLVGQGTADVIFTRPEGVAGVIDGYARRDAGTMLTDLTFDLLSVAGADLPVGGGKTLGLSSLECLGSEATSVTGTAEGMTTRSITKLQQSVTGLRGCMDEVVDTELKRSVPTESRYRHLQSASRFLKVLKGFNFEMLGLDAFVNDATREANLVDIGLRWQGEPTQKPIDASHHDLTGFASPSGNIVCEMNTANLSPEAARCTIFDFTWSVPRKPASCDLDYGPDIELVKRASIMCYGDTVGEEARPDADTTWWHSSSDLTAKGQYDKVAVLAYGRSITTGKITCTSTHGGIRCHNAASGGGFTMSRTAYSLTS